MVKKPNGWVTGEGENPPVIFRRRLKDATLFDRALMTLFVFVIASFFTGGLYWYIVARSDFDFDSHLPLMTKTGTDAREHFLLVCGIGGAICAVGYVILSIMDPYGTTSATKAKAEEQARKRRERFDFLDKPRD